MRIVLRATLLLVAWTPCVAAATQATAPPAADKAPGTLSLDEAIDRALLRSPIVRMAAKARATAATARIGAGQLLPANPAATVTLGHRRDNSGSTPPARGFEWTVRLEQAVDLAGQRGTRLAEAERFVDVAGAREALARAETIARVRAAYITLALSQAHAESALAREKLGQRVLESARARVRAGAASDVELHLAEVEAGRLIHERVEAFLGIDAAAGELRRLLDLPADHPLQLTTALQLPPPAPLADDIPAAIRSAVARRVELKVLAATRTALDASVVRLRREVVPSPTLFVDVQRQQPGQLYVGGGVALGLPVWRRNQGELARTRAQEDELREEEAIAVHDIAIEVARLCRGVRAHREQATLWTEHIVPAALANVDLVHQGWTAGKFDIFRLVTVAREAGEARTHELQVMGDLWAATIELERATGVQQ
jgi:cobalt-zinc-cadmium efflux system outer membrane protein